MSVTRFTQFKKIYIKWIMNLYGLAKIQNDLQKHPAI